MILEVIRFSDMDKVYKSGLFLLVTYSDYIIVNCTIVTVQASITLDL